MNRRIATLGAVALSAIAVAIASDTVPTDIQIPGTQPVPVDNPPIISSVGNCGCHDFASANNLVPEAVPVHGWTGGMMANAGRDPLFWSTVAVAEQDFLPGSGGVGDLCLHCHSVKGWLEGRSTPTDGSGLVATTDGEGIMCEFCHLVVDPDQANSIPNPPEGTYVEEQHAPFEAFDPTGGTGYYGGAEYVLNSGGTRLGPYSDSNAKHAAIPSPYFRDARMCGTCHDVSNPAVGDLAHNHGSMGPLPGTSSGVPNGPVAAKAAMNNPPASYGIVERTFSEWTASALDTWRVNDFAALPADLKVAGGSLERAWRASTWGTCSGTTNLCNESANCAAGQTCTILTADYQQPLVSPPAAGAPRYFTCQTCHMMATGGDGANQGRGNPGDPWRGKIRPDLPTHDLTGMSYWQHDLVQWQDQQGTLLFGGGLTWPDQRMTDAKARSQAHLRAAASLAAAQNGSQLEVRVTNLTGHKLISGYPEGRRMWLDVRWFDAADALVAENGAYGPLLDEHGSPVQVQDRDGTTWQVQSILDVDSTKIYEAKPAMTQEWATQLLALGYPGGMVLEWDRTTNTPAHTLGELGAEAPGALRHTFHFVLNNAVEQDNRIPPYGFRYDEALARNALPVPTTQFGDPGPGGAYNHFDVVPFPIPASATRAEVRLLYQATSWEYIQFLWKQPTSAPAPTSAFLANEGLHMLDAWLNTGMAAPFELTATILALAPIAGVPGEASAPDLPAEQMRASWNATTGRVEITFTPSCDSTAHTIYWGDLAGVSTYAYSGALCGVGSGSASFDPGLERAFFLVVGNNGVAEGSYGTYLPPGGPPTERPEHTGTPGCDYSQDLAGVTCE